MATLTFDSLAKQYDNFSTPQCKILVGEPGSSTKEVKASDFIALSVAVSQTIDSSSTAQITFLSDYSPEKSDFKTDYFGEMGVGKKIEIKLGYKTPQTVFVGAITSVRTDYSANAVTINVTCMDAKVALMYNFDDRSYTEDSSVDKIVSDLLAKRCKKYGKIDVSPKNTQLPKLPWVQLRLDDLQFVTQLAALTNSSFYTCCDEMRFVENVFTKFCKGSGSSAVKLGWGAGLMSFSADIDISAQVGSVRIIYRNESNKKVPAIYNGSDISGSGSLPSGAKGDIVGGKIVEREETLVKTDAQAKAVATNIYMRALLDYVKASGQTIGIPDIKVADAIEFTGLGKKLNGKYFLSRVNHQFDAGGYLTSFTCNRPKI